MDKFFTDPSVASSTAFAISVGFGLGGLALSLIKLILVNLLGMILSFVIKKGE